MYKYIIFLLVTVVVILNSCLKPTENKDSFTIYETSAEYVKDNFLTDENFLSNFKGVENKTTDYVRTGEYAIKTDTILPYGFSISIDSLKEGELFQASVWQKDGAKDGTLICAIEGEHSRHIRTFLNRLNNPVDGWVEHKLSVIIGKGVKKISFYVFSGKSTAYFDDIQIKRFAEIPHVKSKKSINIYIPPVSKDKLDGYITSALSSDIISKKDKKYVDAFLLQGADSIPIKMRLKGDWTDHLTSGKISFRIKVRGDNAFMGLKTFSIQHPNTRNDLNEWFMHKLFDKEGLLSTTYEILPVTINGTYKGVYAIEEHFDKQLLESRQRREGPILKFDESGFWALGYLPDSVTGNKSYPYYKASFISVFKKNRTLKNKVLKQQFIEGAIILNHFKNHTASIESIFDITDLAKCYALTELGNGKHGLFWHNRRFYFNPITQKLEHIGFDMLAGADLGSNTMVKNGLINTGQSTEYNLDMYVLKNKKFRKEYIFYLKQFTKKSYLDSCFKKYDKALKINEKMMSTEISNYSLNKKFYYERAAKIREGFEELDSLWDVYMTLDLKKIKIKNEKYIPHQTNFFIEELSVNAYVNKIDSAKYFLELENFHLNDVTVLGYLTKQFPDSVIKFKKPLELSKFTQNKVAQAELITIYKPKAIVLKIANDLNSTYTKKVLKWQKPKGITSRMKAEKNFKPNSSLFKLVDDVLIFKQGNLNITELLIVPKKYKVLIKSGTKINLHRGGGLVINNTLNIEGSKNDSVIFYSSDGNNNGLTVLNVKKVDMQYVSFKNLQALHFKKWNLTGAICIYESDVKLSNVSIKNNKSEDALNIIRSRFNITDLLISNTFSDGFDADFCSGEILNSMFNNTGNDCIDFSGSNVLIKNIKINKSGDKGISGGEKSNLTLKSIFINGAITGVASKDGTLIKGNTIQILNVEYGLACFKKKPEYEIAKIKMNDVDLKNVKTNKILIDLGSEIIINGKTYKGKKKLNIQALYARFEKK